MTGTVLITGGMGFVGAALAKRLVAEGRTVRVLDNLWRGGRGRLDGVAQEIEFIDGDIRDGAAVTAAARGADTVFHLAFINGTEFFYSNPDLVLDVGVRGMMNVIDACLTHDVGELILASSSEVYQTPPRLPADESVPLLVPDVMNPRYSYGGAKIISELLAVNFGREKLGRVLIFRPHNVYGPDMGWEHVLPQFVLRMKALVQETDKDPVPFPIQGDGTQTRSFVHIDDFIDGAMVMWEKGEHLNIYHIGNDEEVSIADVASMIGAYYGRRVKTVAGPPAPGAAPRRCPDISKLAALGYVPRIKLADGIRLLADWYDAHAGQAPKAGG